MVFCCPFFFVGGGVLDILYLNTHKPRDSVETCFEARSGQRDCFARLMAYPKAPMQFLFGLVIGDSSILPAKRYYIGAFG